MVHMPLRGQSPTSGPSASAAKWLPLTPIGGQYPWSWAPSIHLTMGGDQAKWMTWSGLADRMATTLAVSLGSSTSSGISLTTLIPAGSKTSCMAFTAARSSGMFRYRMPTVLAWKTSRTYCELACASWTDAMWAGNIQGSFHSEVKKPQEPNHGTLALARSAWTSPVPQVIEVMKENTFSSSTSFLKQDRNRVRSPAESQSWTTTLRP